MRSFGFLVAILLMALSLACSSSNTDSDNESADDDSDEENATFTLASDDITGDTIPAEHSLSEAEGCTGSSGSNSSPHLGWSNAPTENIGSFAITMQDLDANFGDATEDIPFVHWIVYNIPTSVSELDANISGNVPSGASEGPTHYGSGISGYGGPCPPAGETHTYQFTVWALGIEDLADDSVIGSSLLDATAGQLMAAIERHAEESASFSANYTGE